MNASRMETERDRLVELVDGLSLLSASPISSEELVQQAVELVMRLTRATGSVLEVRSDDDLVYRNAAGTVADFVGLRIPIDSSLSGSCVRHRQVMYSSDTHDDARVNLEAANKVAARSMMVVPLTFGTHTLGVLKAVSTSVANFDEIDELALTSSARLIAGLLVRHGALELTPTP